MINWNVLCEIWFTTDNYLFSQNGLFKILFPKISTETFFRVYGKVWWIKKNTYKNKFLGSNVPPVLSRNDPFQSIDRDADEIHWCSCSKHQLFNWNYFTHESGHRAKHRRLHNEDKKSKCGSIKIHNVMEWEEREVHENEVQKSNSK